MQKKCEKNKEIVLPTEVLPNFGGFVVRHGGLHAPVEPAVPDLRVVGARACSQPQAGSYQ